MTHAFPLPAELTVYGVTETQAAMLAWLGGSGDGADAASQPLIVDAQQVIDVDAAGVQLLCALSASLSQRGQTWQLQAPPRILTQACARLGMADWLAAHTEARAS